MLTDQTREENAIGETSLFNNYMSYMEFTLLFDEYSFQLPR